jgi:peptide/nickel transport system substrate-binding protein
MKSQLAKVGIDLEIQSLDWGTFYGDVRKGHFQLYSLSWVGLKLPNIFRHAFHSESVPPNGANRGRYRQPMVDELIQEAEFSDNQRSHVEIYQALNERLMYDLPYVPLWYEDQLLVMRDAVVGYSTDVDGSFDALEKVAKVDSFGDR